MNQFPVEQSIAKEPTIFKWVSAFWQPSWSSYGKNSMKLSSLKRILWEQKFSFGITVTVAFPQDVSKGDANDQHRSEFLLTRGHPYSIGKKKKKKKKKKKE